MQPTDSKKDADGRRTLGKLPASFGRGFVGVFSEASVEPFVLGLVATGFALPLDESVAATDNDNEGRGSLGAGFGKPALVGGLAVVMLFGGRLATDQRFRDASYDVFVATGLTFGYTEAIKLAVGRTRPDGDDEKSFPSGHTSNAFAWATVAEHHYGMAVGAPMYLLASLIGVSRISDNRHHLSDVIAGAAVGFIVAKSVLRQNGVPLGERSVSLQPAVGPSGQHGLVVVFRF